VRLETGHTHAQHARTQRGKMDKKRNEFRNIIKQLDEESQLDIFQYMVFLLAAESSKYKFIPPTAEQWLRVPKCLKWNTNLILFACTWESRLAEIGLRLGAM
jgi:hypothetical protein